MQDLFHMKPKRPVSHLQSAYFFAKHTAIYLVQMLDTTVHSSHTVHQDWSQTDTEVSQKAAITAPYPWCQTQKQIQHVLPTCSRGESPHAIHS